MGEVNCFGSEKELYDAYLTLAEIRGDIKRKEKAEDYSREFLRQAGTFRALASLMRKKTPQTAKDLAMILVAEGLADVCEGLAESVMKEEK